MLRIKICGFVCFLLFVLSCKSTKTFNVGKVSNISDIKLRKELKDNELKYEKIYLKKINFSFNDGNQKRSFKGSFVIQKDSQIVVSIYALMGIELVRTKLTKQDVTIIDKHNKKVFKTDYSYFKDRFGIDLSYSIIQSLITNSLFLYPDEDVYYEGLKKYKHHINEEFYSFKSIKDKRINRLTRRSRNDLVIHEIDIYPESFKIFKVFIKDWAANQKLEVQYNNFKNFNEVLFPEDIVISASQGIRNVDVVLKVNYIEINKGGSLHFKIPSSYEFKEL